MWMIWSILGIMLPLLGLAGYYSWRNKQIDKYNEEVDKYNAWLEQKKAMKDLPEDAKPYLN
jgi:predicted negative regulator of RcsB-dependent stress response